MGEASMARVEDVRRLLSDLRCSSLSPLVRSAYGAQTKAAVQAGDVDALMRAAAGLASQWVIAAGHQPAAAANLSTIACVMATPMQAVLLAAARDLLELIRLSPDGRKALAELHLEPLLEHVEGPRS